MTGFDVKDGIAYKVELPDDTDGVVTETVEAIDGSSYNVEKTCEILGDHKNALSAMLLSMADDVTAAYAKIHAKPSPYDPPATTAMTYDMHMMTDKYNDYYRGMVSYVEMICDIQPGELNENEVEMKINKAISNDPGFITAVSEYDDMDLSRCIKQTEQVVEIIHEIDDRINQIKQIFAKAPKNQFTALAERLICGSLCKYTELLVRTAKFNKNSLHQILTTKSGALFKPAPTEPQIAANAFKML